MAKNDPDVTTRSSRETQSDMSDQAQGVTAAESIRARIANATDLLKTLKDDLDLRVATIEAHLGFVAQADDLAVRVAKLEKFLGLAG